MKTCSKCKLKFEYSEFCKDRASPDGLFHYCRSCLKSQNKKWETDNPGKNSARAKKWNEEHPERVRQNAIRRYKNNPKKYLDFNRKYRKLNPLRAREIKSAAMAKRRALKRKS